MGGSNKIYRFHEFRLEEVDARLYMGSEIVGLKPKAFELVLYMVKNAGRLVTREELMTAVWPDTVVEESNLNVHVSLIRKALADDANDPRLIQTVPKRGYRFIAPVEVVEEGSEQWLEPAARTGVEERKEAEDERISEKEEPASMPSSRPAAAPGRRWGFSRTIGWELLGLAVLGIAIFMIMAYRRGKTTRAPVTAPLEIRVLTSYSGDERFPAFSPDEKRIAFSWSGVNDDNYDIYTKSIEGGAPVRLTDNPGRDLNPVWSPDGRQLAFYRQSLESEAVYLISAEGGSERQLYQSPIEQDYAIHPSWLAWSRDGAWLAASIKAAPQRENRTPRSIYRISIPEGERRPLTSPGAEWQDDSPVFSPNGNSLAFIRSRGWSEREILVLSMQNGALRTLQTTTELIMGLAWTANGKGILYTTFAPPAARLHFSPIDGRMAAILLPILGMNMRELCVSEKSGQVVWSQSNFGDGDIGRIELAGAKAPQRALPILDSPSTEYDGQISPDGTRIAYSLKSGNAQIWRSNSEGRDRAQLSHFEEGSAGTPRWSPDGRWIVFDHWIGNQSSIWKMDADGGSMRQLTKPPLDGAMPFWSREGDWILFDSATTGRREIWKVPAAGGDPVQVTREGGAYGIESPDGAWLYFRKGRHSPGIWRIPVRGGSESFFYKLPSPRYSRAWDVTREGLVYAYAAPAENQIRVEMIRIADRSVRQLASLRGTLSEGYGGLSVSSDAGWMILPIHKSLRGDIVTARFFIP